MASKLISKRDSAGLSGIKWDKWDSVGRAAQAQGATAAPDAGPIAGRRGSTDERPLIRTAAAVTRSLSLSMARF